MISFRSVRGRLAYVVLAAFLFAGVCPVSAQTGNKRPGPTPNPGAGAAPSPSVAPYVLPDTVATIDGEVIGKKEVEPLTALLAANGGKALHDLPPAELRQAYQSVVNNILVDRLVSKQRRTSRSAPST